MATTEWNTLPGDLEILRTLAGHIRAIADDPVNRERKRLWHAYDAGRAERPMLLAESWVAYDDLPQSEVRCQEEWARKLEYDLRFRIFVFENIQDDHVIEPFVTHNWRVNVSDYGVQSKREVAERVSGNVSCSRWDPPIKDLDADFDKLHPRTYSVDREATLAWQAHLESVFDGILGVRLRGGFWWTTGMTIVAIDLIGLENLMLYMLYRAGGLAPLDGLFCATTTSPTRNGWNAKDSSSSTTRTTTPAPAA